MAPRKKDIRLRQLKTYLNAACVDLFALDDRRETIFRLFEDNGLSPDLIGRILGKTPAYVTSVLGRSFLDMSEHERKRMDAVDRFVAGIDPDVALDSIPKECR